MTHTRRKRAAFIIRYRRCITCKAKIVSRETVIRIPVAR